MTTAFLSVPMKERALGQELIGRIEALGFDVLSALGDDSPDDAPPEEMFRTNVELIRRSDIFVAVLGNHGKDLAAEVGMAYAWDMPRLGVDSGTGEDDVMVRQALERIVRPEDLADALRDVAQGAER